MLTPFVKVKLGKGQRRSRRAKNGPGALSLSKRDAAEIRAFAETLKKAPRSTIAPCKDIAGLYYGKHAEGSLR